MSYIYIHPSKARNANVVYIWTYVWQRFTRSSIYIYEISILRVNSFETVIKHLRLFGDNKTCLVNFISVRRSKIPFHTVKENQI